MDILKKPIGFLFFCLITSCQMDAQQTNQTKVDAKGNEMLVGKIDKNGLEHMPYASWFEKNYGAYEVDSKTIKSIKNELRTYSITLFLGTWCGDSKREVPRCYRILEEAKFPMDQLTVVALDYEGEQYKKSPGGEEQGLNIVKVPTFIFSRNGKEMNRIVESPIETLEKDMAAIVTGKNYSPNYSAARVALPQD